MLASIQLTEKCNLNCKYCFQGEKGTSFMSLDKGKESLDFVHSQYQRIVAEKDQFEELLIVFYGGEPMLEFDLMKTLILYSEAKAKEHPQGRVKYSIISNGYAFTEEKVAFLEKYKDKFTIKISLDGKKDTHDANRVTPANQGTYDTVLKNMQLIKERLGPIRVCAVVTPTHAQHLYSNIVDLAEKGFQKIEFDIAVVQGWTLKEFNILDEELEKLMHYYLERLKEEPDFSLVTFDYWLKPLVYKSGPVILCGAGENSFFINTQGQIYTCPFGNGFEECHFGNVKEGFNDNVHLIKKIDLDLFPDECKDCAYYDKCCFSCVAQNKILSESIYDIPPLNCAKSQLGLGKAIRFGNLFHQKYPELFTKRFHQEQIS